MHVLLGLVISVLMIIILLKKLADAGVSLGGLNPFSERTKTRLITKTIDKPIYRLRTPLEAAGVLLVASAKADGDLTNNGKELLLKLFREQFGLSDEQASSLLQNSVNLFGDGVEVLEDLEDVLEPVIDQFKDGQQESLIEMMEQVACHEGQAAVAKLNLIASAKTQFAVDRARQSSPWGR